MDLTGYPGAPGIHPLYGWTDGWTNGSIHLLVLEMDLKAPAWLPNHLGGSPEAMGASKPPGSSFYPGDPYTFPPLLFLP